MIEAGAGGRGAAARRVPPSVLGMSLFVSSEVMFFGGLFASYFMLRGTAGPAWPPEGSVETSLVLPVALTAILLASSVTVHLGRLGLTIFLGTLFLAGQAWEYAQLGAEGLSASTDVFATLFFTITGFHGLHVAVGLVMLTAARLRQPRGPEAQAEAAAYYWHFVDAVWVLVFLTLYVLR
ncbi:MAG: heme-copper oxidase subunit III [Actinomycetota bacterium]|nr:heme-copper oxidase subunit III [Actinomycetota bacterium]